jgi:hypothetical protein
MQEARGSSPLSSTTVQKIDFEHWTSNLLGREGAIRGAVPSRHQLVDQPRPDRGHVGVALPGLGRRQQVTSVANRNPGCLGSKGQVSGLRRGQLTRLMSSYQVHSELAEAVSNVAARRSLLPQTWGAY